MKSKIIKAAVGLPHAFPWKRENLGIEDETLKEKLKEYGLDTLTKRRVAGWKINYTIFKNILIVNNKNELLNSVISSMENEKYLDEELVSETLRRKRFDNEKEIALFKSFIKDTMSIDEKHKNNKNIITWLVELVTFKRAMDSTVSQDEINDEVVEIANKYFNEISVSKEIVRDSQHRQGLNRVENITLINKVFKNEVNVYSELLSKYIKENDREKDVNASTFEDSLFDILNDIDDNTNVNLEDINSSRNEVVEVAPIIEPIKEIIEKRQEVKATNILVNVEVEKNLKALSRSLGYEVIKINDYTLGDENKEIEMLKELASLKKGAVLSELYNACTNIENISKENLEAVLTNFFTALKIQGFDVDEENKVGDTIKVDTKDVLKEFVFSHPTEVKGQVEGTIDFLSWNYKGEKVTPMVIKPKK